MFLTFGKGKHFRFEELAISEFSKVNFSMVPLPLLPASLLGIRLLARSELVQGGVRNLEKLWVSLLISPLYQSIIFCCCCNMFVGSLKTCFEFLPLRCYLQKVGWGDLMFSLPLSNSMVLMLFLHSSPATRLMLSGTIPPRLEELLDVFHRNENSCSYLLCSQ